MVSHDEEAWSAGIAESMVVTCVKDRGSHQGVRHLLECIAEDGRMLEPEHLSLQSLVSLVSVLRRLPLLTFRPLLLRLSTRGFVVSAVRSLSTSS